MMAKLTSKNQLTLPKDIVRRFPETRYFEVTEAEVENALIIGTPEQCVEKLKRYEALGIHNMQMNMNFGANHRDVLRSLELFATRVMPHFA